MIRIDFLKQTGQKTFPSCPSMENALEGAQSHLSDGDPSRSLQSCPEKQVPDEGKAEKASCREP